jgi:hypothetical protein
MTVTVTLIHSGSRWPLRRRQPWRWIATARNGRTVALSGESYTNRSDALHAIFSLFGEDVRVVTRGQ